MARDKVDKLETKLRKSRIKEQSGDRINKPAQDADSAAFERLVGMSNKSVYGEWKPAVYMTREQIEAKRQSDADAAAFQRLKNTGEEAFRANTSALMDRSPKVREYLDTILRKPDTLSTLKAPENMENAGVGVMEEVTPTHYGADALNALKRLGYNDKQISDMLYLRGTWKNENIAQQARNAYARFAYKAPLTAWSASIPFNLAFAPLKAVDVMAQSIAKLTGLMDKDKPLDYEATSVVSDYAPTVRDTQSQWLAEHTKAKVPILGTNLAASAYGLLSSTADSMAAASTGLKDITSALLGGAAASQALIEGKERGVSDEENITYALAAGLNEYLGERWSIGNLINMRPAASFAANLKNVIIQSGVEASEEGATTLANTIADYFIRGDKSDYNVTFQRLKESGMGEDEARKEANIEWLKGLAGDILGGFLSGGLMSGAYQGIQNAQTYKAYGQSKDETDMIVLKGIVAGGSAAKAAQSLQNYAARGIINAKPNVLNKKRGKTLRLTEIIQRNKFEQAAKGEFMRNGANGIEAGRLAAIYSGVELGQGVSMSDARKLAKSKFLGPVIEKHTGWDDYKDNPKVLANILFAQANMNSLAIDISEAGKTAAQGLYEMYGREVSPVKWFAVYNYYWQMGYAGNSVFGDAVISSDRPEAPWQSAEIEGRKARENAERGQAPEISDTASAEEPGAEEEPIATPVEEEEPITPEEAPAEEEEPIAPPTAEAAPVVPPVVRGEPTAPPVNLPRPTGVVTPPAVVPPIVTSPVETETPPVRTETPPVNTAPVESTPGVEEHAPRYGEDKLPTDKNTRSGRLAIVMNQAIGKSKRYKSAAFMYRESIQVDPYFWWASFDNVYQIGKYGNPMPENDERTNPKMALNPAQFEAAWAAGHYDHVDEMQPELERWFAEIGVHIPINRQTGEIDYETALDAYNLYNYNEHNEETRAKIAEIWPPLGNPELNIWKEGSEESDEEPETVSDTGTVSGTRDVGSESSGVLGGIPPENGGSVEPGRHTVATPTVEDGAAGLDGRGTDGRGVQRTGDSGNTEGADIRPAPEETEQVAKPETKKPTEGKKPTEAKKPTETEPKETTAEEEAKKPGPVEAVTADEQIAKAGEVARQQSPKGDDYVIPEDYSPPTSPQARYEANIAAIKTVKNIQAEDRPATAEEQKILADYTGWGGLTKYFDEGSESDNLLRALLPGMEYQNARSSILDAYYTGSKIVRAIYKGLKHLGFKGGSILEPSCGTGRFLGCIPAELRNNLYIRAVEIDNMSGAIAKLLYPNAHIRIGGFEETRIVPNTADLVITNVPFGEQGIKDKSGGDFPDFVTSKIHNYFIAKSIRAARPGGIVCVITEHSTLDSSDVRTRKHFAEEADLLGAIRLPNNAFKGTGTAVITDILVFKKRSGDNKTYGGEKFINPMTQRLPFNKDAQLAYGTWVNEYFVNHPDMVLGELQTTKNQYGKTVLDVKPADTDKSLNEQIEEAFNKITGKMEYPEQKTHEEMITEIKQSGETESGLTVIKDGEFYTNEAGNLVPLDIPEKEKPKIEPLLKIRDTLKKLLDAQRDGAPESERAELRKQLNEQYDEFVKKYGSIRSGANKKAVKLTGDAARLSALENKKGFFPKVEYVKATVFFKDTIAPHVTPLHADTIEDAMTISINETMSVDVAMIARLTDDTEENARDELLKRGLVFMDKNRELVPSNIYLSGNVRAKLAEAEALADTDERYKANVEALKEVMPKDVKPEDMSIEFGSPWIPVAVYGQFIKEAIYENNSDMPPFKISYKPSTGFAVIHETGGDTLYLRTKWTASHVTQYSTPDYPFMTGSHNMVEAVLNNRRIVVNRSKDDGGGVDLERTQLAQQAADNLKKKFKEWVFDNDTLLASLAKLYNETYNSFVETQYDGTNFTVNGMTTDLEPRPYQKNAAQRIVQGQGATLLAHEAGAGKTLTMIMAMAKRLQLGLSNRICLTVPNHLVKQWEADIHANFPLLKVKVVNSKNIQIPNREKVGKRMPDTPEQIAKKAEARKKFITEVQTGDYDIILLSHDQFGSRIGLAKQEQERFLLDQIRILEQAKADAEAEAKESGEDRARFGTRQLVTEIKKLKARVAEVEKIIDGDYVRFEDLGCDSLFVDEAHEFKNLYNFSRLDAYAVTPNESSKQAFDMYMKTQYFHELNGGRGLVFATATPVMNIASELFTMSKFMAPDLLKKQNIEYLDAFLAVFGDVGDIDTITVSGQTYESKRYLLGYKNMPELMQVYRTYADIVTAADLPKNVRVPKIKGGKRTTIKCPASEFQIKVMEELAYRRKHMDDKGILGILHDGKLISYSQHMYDRSKPYEENGKIVTAANNIYRIWKESKTFKGYDGETYENGTQLVFLDMGTPGGNKEKNVAPLYKDIKQMLVDMGIPANEIAFMQDVDNVWPSDKDNPGEDLDERKGRHKAELFEKMNNGEVRILIGSTEAMGTGMNAQRRIVALHELDAPDRPGDVIQNEHRALRHGNLNAEVEICVYVTEQTFDTASWDRLNRKAAFINQVNGGRVEGRTAEGDSDLQTSAEEIAAIASGNPLVKRKHQVSREINKLEALKSAVEQKAAKAKKRIKDIRVQIDNLNKKLTKYKADAEIAQDTSGENFKMVINGETYDKRKDAGKALLQLYKKLCSSRKGAEKYHEVGEFAGFKLYVSDGASGQISVKGAASHSAKIITDNAPKTVTDLEKVIRNLKPDVEKAEKSIQTLESELELRKKESTEVFDKNDELIKLKAELADIIEQLRETPTQAPAPDEFQSVEKGGKKASVEKKPKPKPKRPRVPGLYKSTRLKLPASHPEIGEYEGVNIDLGGNKDTRAYLAHRGTSSYEYNPESGNTKENNAALQIAHSGGAETVTCAERLNTIKDENERGSYILEAASLLKKGGTAYFSIDEGDGSGIGSRTADGWQANRKASSYMAEIRKHFNGAERHGNIIIATEPKLNRGQAKWESIPAKDVKRWHRTIEPLRKLPPKHAEEWDTVRYEANKENPRNVGECLQMIQTVFGVHITTGYIRNSRVRGFYRPANKGIRIKYENELPVACHELGHALDDRFGILKDAGSIPQQTAEELEAALGDLASAYPVEIHLEEGFAEFLRVFMQNRTFAAGQYPGIMKLMHDKIDGKTMADIEHVADVLNATYAESRQTLQPFMRDPESRSPDDRTYIERVMDAWDKVVQETTDAVRPLTNVNKKVASLAYNAAYATDRANYLIQKDLVDFDGNYVGEGLSTRLSKIKGWGDPKIGKQVEKDFNEYLVARHALEVMAKKKQAFADISIDEKWCNDRIEKLELEYDDFRAASEDVYNFISTLMHVWAVGRGLVPVDLVLKLEQLEPCYVPFYRDMESLTKKRGKRPGSVGLYDEPNAVKRMNGSGLPILFPIANIETKVYEICRQAVEFAPRQELYNACVTTGPDGSVLSALIAEAVTAERSPKSVPGFGIREQMQEELETLLGVSMADDSIDVVAGHPYAGKPKAALATEMKEAIERAIPAKITQWIEKTGHGTYIGVPVKGEMKYMLVHDESILEALSNMSPPQLKGFMRVLNATNNFFKMNTTGRNLIWALMSNMPRDFCQWCHTFLADEHGIKKIEGIGRGLAEVVKSYMYGFRQIKGSDKYVDPAYRMFCALGGTNAATWEINRDLGKAAKGIRNDALRRSRVANSKLWKWVYNLNPIENYCFACDAIEAGWRYAAFKTALKNGESPQEAFNTAMEVTVDFRRHAGSKTVQSLNVIFPYFNAAMQGASRYVRYVTAEDKKGSPDRAKCARGRLLSHMATAILLAALTVGLNRRDDEHEEEYELLSSYTKNSKFCIPDIFGDGQYLCIPKARETAILETLFEHIFEIAFFGDRKAFNGFYEHFMDTFLPSPAAALAGGNILDVFGSMGVPGYLAQIKMNRDFLGRPIVSKWEIERNIPKPMQYGDRTTVPAKWLGDILNMSPKQIDFFASNVLGFWWKQWPAATWKINEAPDWTFGVRQQFVKDNAFSQDIVNWLYDETDAAQSRLAGDEENSEYMVDYKLMDVTKTFYSRWNKLARGEGRDSRDTRHAVMSMLVDFRELREQDQFDSGLEIIQSAVRATGDTSLMPSALDPKIKDENGTEHTLTAEQYYDYQMAYNGYYYSYANNMITPGMDARKKAALLREAKQFAKNNALKLVRPELATDMTAKYGAASEEEIMRFRSEISVADDDGLKQDEVIGIIQLMISQGMDYESADALFHSRYKSDKNNPYAQYRR